MRYDDYLKSNEWRMFKRDVLETAKPVPGVNVNFYRCEECKETFPYRDIDVHHLTYERLGRERRSDVQVLCHICHAAAHGKQPHLNRLAGPHKIGDIWQDDRQ